MSSGTRRRTTAVAALAASALALPLVLVGGSASVAAPAPEPVPTRVEHDPTALSRALAAAVQEAAARRAAEAPAATLDAHGRKPVRPTPPTLDRRALDAAVQGVLDTGAIGVVARIEAPGVRWSTAAGSRRLDGRPQAHVGDRFEVGSITKPMVATLVMQEVEKGTWALGTRVEDVLPGVLPGRPDVTIEHLLSHRSGLPTGTDVMWAMRMTDPTSVDEFFEVLGQEYTAQDHVAAALATPWLFEPGTDFSYSNAGYVVLGMMLEEVTGQELAGLLRDRVLRPAGMRHTELPHEPRSHGPFLVGGATFGEPYGGWRSLGHVDPDLYGAAGAVTSTTADLLSFTDALVEGRLLRPGTVADMATPRTGGDAPYGLGVILYPDLCAPAGSGAYLYGHNGATFGTYSLVLSSPDGSRSISLGATGRDLTDPEDILRVNALAVPMILATC